MPMTCRFMGQTDPGLVRTSNQDSYFCDPGGRYFIVADGMGGHAGGEEASRIAVESVRAYLDEAWNSEQDSQSLLEIAIAQANQEILNDQIENPVRQDMGTTIVVVLLRHDQALGVHVGDSRLYHLQQERLVQITTDHTWVGQAVSSGDITVEQAKSHPWRHVLSQCLGRSELDRVDIVSLEVEPGDRLLLCSDGLTEEVEDSDIQHILSRNDDPGAATSSLIHTAKANGGSDNVTVILVEVVSAN